MAKRIRVGIPFVFDESWIGGVYYIINMIMAFNLLRDTRKPYLKIYYSNIKSLSYLYTIRYPYIEFINLNISLIQKSIFKRFLNKLSKTIFQRYIFDVRLTLNDIDFLFPAIDHKLFSLFPDNRKIFWFPDLQHHYLKDFFSDQEIQYRKSHEENCIKRGVKMLFSSKTSACNMISCYPQLKITDLLIIPFVVFINSDYLTENIDKIIIDNNISKKYFLCSNQFWAHKNHILIFKALKILKEKNIKCSVVFTGMANDYRNPDNFELLTQYIADNKLNDYVKILGFISRNIQLKFMNDSIAVIQPSLFEGWSTVVEDCKAMNKHIILSDLEVHREQIHQNVTFFQKNNEKELSLIMQTLILTPPKESRYDYSSTQIDCANKFISTLEQLY